METLTQSRIAQELDISRSYLSTLPVFKRAWKQRKGAKTDYSRKHTVRDRQGRDRPRIWEGALPAGLPAILPAV